MYSYCIVYLSVLKIAGNKEHLHTFVTNCVSISRFTSPFTVTGQFVTMRVIQTVTATVVDTVIAIGSILTYCKGENN